MQILSPKSESFIVFFLQRRVWYPGERAAGGVATANVSFPLWYKEIYYFLIFQSHRHKLCRCLRIADDRDMRLDLLPLRTGVPHIGYLAFGFDDSGDANTGQNMCDRY
ncbi:hypothetical protein [Dickeya fangzhongdai]|uniref:hypothetical protein n=1 Tax=Dickeya fangzhongdai TaxID=1778540 RepID=UPI00103D4626|nr:hypothetical protein [Dickeya fangzhongdai]